MFLGTVAISRAFGIFALLSSLAYAEQYGSEPVAKAERHVPAPYKLRQGTFVSVVLESVRLTSVSAVVESDVYDAFENIAIPKGSRLLGHQLKVVNGRHDILLTGLQLDSVSGIYKLQPPLHATTPLGATGLEDFREGALAGALLAVDIIIPH